MVRAMSVDETTRKAAGRILAWYEAMGVDAALEEQPLDWLAHGGAAPGAPFSLPAGSSAAAGDRSTPTAASTGRTAAADLCSAHTTCSAGPAVPGARTRRAGR